MIATLRLWQTSRTPGRSRRRTTINIVRQNQGWLEQFDSTLTTVLTPAGTTIGSDPAARQLRRLRVFCDVEGQPLKQEHR